MKNFLGIDTNIALDLLVFGDAQARPPKAALVQGDLRWLATASMRAEFERVLDCAQIASRLALHGLQTADVLAASDRDAQMVEAPGKAGVTCSDPDDQKFIDLAVEHRCLLPNAAVWSMKKRLAAIEVSVSAAMPASCCTLCEH